MKINTDEIQICRDTAVLDNKYAKKNLKKKRSKNNTEKKLKNRNQ